MTTLADYREQRDAADRWVAAFQRRETEALARGDDVSRDEAVRALLAATDAEVPRPSVPWSFSRYDWVIALTVLGMLALRWVRHRCGAA